MKAQETGTKLERQIKCLLKESNIPFKFQVPNFCIGITGEDVRVDFLVNTMDSFKAIEVKWQQSRGSVDTKLFYLIYNIKEKYPVPTIIIIDGGGIRPKLLEWITAQIGGNFVGFYTLSEFIAELNNDHFKPRS